MSDPAGDFQNSHAEFRQRYAAFQEAWRLVGEAERDLRRSRWRAGRWKRWTVCWWRHRPGRIPGGGWVSPSCWRTVLTPGGTPVADRRRHDGFTWTRDDGDQVDAFAKAVAASTGINPDMISELMGYGKDGRYR